MVRTAKIFTTGGSQAVRLPADFRFDASEVYIWKDAVTGNVTLSARAPDDWDSFAALRDSLGAAPADFLVDRDQATESRDPFEGWRE